MEAKNQAIFKSKRALDRMSSNDGVSNSEEMDLGLQYLEEWGLSKTTIKNFEENEITFQLMGDIHDAELRDLIPNIKERILFRRGMERLQQVIHDTASEDTASNGSSSSSSFGLSDQCMEKCHEQIDLKHILKTTNCGEMCLASAHKPLDNTARNNITKTIVEYYIKCYGRMTSQDFDILADQIVKLFPSECKETYYVPSRKYGEKSFIPARAKLPDRYRNQRRVLKKAGALKPLPTTSDTTGIVIGGSSSDISSEEAEEHKLWLKFYKEPFDEILDKWTKTRKYRVEFIAEEKNTILDILTEWPSLKMSLGYKLVEADFNAMHPQCELNLYKNWPTFMEKARPIYKNLKTVDTNLLDEEKLSEDAADYIFFKLMSCKMPPTVKVPIKENGKNKFYKPSIVESQNAFILHVTNQSEIKNKLEQYQKMHLSRGTTFQPLIIAVGQTSKDLQTFYVAVESVLYKVDKLLTAVDVCFKVINVTNVQYPPECVSIWTFIQKYLYKITNKTDKKISSVSCFISDLTDLKY